MKDAATQDLRLNAASAVVLALDVPAQEAKAGGAAVWERAYFLAKASDLLEGKAPGLKRVDAGTVFAAGNQPYFSALESNSSAGNVLVVVYPTRTASDGFGGNLFSEIAPEDRHMIRKIRARFAGQTSCQKVALRDTALFESIPGFFGGDAEREKYRAERAAGQSEEQKAAAQARRGFVEFDRKFISQMKGIFASCMTKPNKQDYIYLATKTFGLNLVVRLAFVTKSVMAGQLPMFRAVVSTSWYQLQDAVFTVFGQTYMKFLGKMTGMLRLHNAYVGDFVFVYIQLCVSEFVNRLVLGPIGENPLVYSWSGMTLIFVNILQGMCSGGPITPAINKVRKAGAISHSTMMHFYQLASLTMHFGLFATFGYQKFYAILTGLVLVVSWSVYVVFSVFFKDPEFSSDAGLVPKLDAAAAGCYARA